MSLYRNQLRDKVAGLLRQTTDAQDNVLTSTPYPTEIGELPVVFVTVPSESASSNGRHAPDYTRVVQLEVVARVTAQSPATVQALLDRIAEDIEMSIMCSHDIMGMVQQVSSIETEQQVSAEAADIIGAVRLTFGMEYTQEYPVTELVPLTGISGAMTGAIQAGFSQTFPQEN
ncbi:hypothetical protein [Acetobacter okinawensis]|uniref:hypothetical protein n=1 Tax=Acetobacter okinawensis TaxID=1076594 RepID=UPI0039ECDACA